MNALFLQGETIPGSAEWPGLGVADRPAGDFFPATGTVLSAGTAAGMGMLASFPGNGGVPGSWPLGSLLLAQGSKG